MRQKGKSTPYNEEPCRCTFGMAFKLSPALKNCCVSKAMPPSRSVLCGDRQIVFYIHTQEVSHSWMSNPNGLVPGRAGARGVHGPAHPPRWSIAAGCRRWILGRARSSAHGATPYRLVALGGGDSTAQRDDLVKSTAGTYSGAAGEFIFVVRDGVTSLISHPFPIQRHAHQVENNWAENRFMI